MIGLKRHKTIAKCGKKHGEKLKLKLNILLYRTEHNKHKQRDKKLTMTAINIFEIDTKKCKSVR